MMVTQIQDSTPTKFNNSATRTVASTLGVLVGIGSIDHGLLECRQGFRPTPVIIVWSVRFPCSPFGPSVFLSLAVLSFLTGSGVAQVVLFTLAWAVATRTGGSLTFLRRLLLPSARPLLGRLWPWTLVAATVLFILALEIAVFGYVPGVSDQTRILRICWTSLAVALALNLISIVSGFAHDLEVQSRLARA